MPTGNAGERGYTLVALVGVLTVMAIALAAALPHWSALARRERETELVARGFQYAEAIRVFQRRFGRLPTELAELVEVEPRALRRLWKDPMTDDGTWILLIEGAGGAIVPVDPRTGAVVGGGALEPADEEVPSTTPFGRRIGAEQAIVGGAIHGVKSRARGEALRLLFGQKDFGDWEFTVEKLVAETAATTPSGLPRRVDYATLGRPFRYPPPGTVPDERESGESAFGSESERSNESEEEEEEYEESDEVEAYEESDDDERDESAGEDDGSEANGGEGEGA